MSNTNNSGPILAILFLFVLGMILLVAWARERKKKRQLQERLEYLRNKYRDEATVQLILQRNFWQGQTSEQLIDSLGDPVAVDRKVFKTKTRETWKYNRWGTNRYGLRINLESGIVVGWDNKSL